MAIPAARQEGAAQVLLAPVAAQGTRFVVLTVALTLGLRRIARLAGMPVPPTNGVAIPETNGTDAKGWTPSPDAVNAVIPVTRMKIVAPRAIRL